MPKSYYFFIGTVAEFIKLMPVMQELSRRNASFKIIASGQNRITDCEILTDVGLERVDIVVNQRPIRKSAIGLFLWFFETLFKAFGKLRPEFSGKGESAVLIVHGDTVSTVMGAFLGKMFGLKVAHVEAGLRSFNFLQPFPEELDRYIASYFVDVHFCPYDTAVQNLRRRRGIKVDTGFNTNIDSLAYALTNKHKPDILSQIGGRKYFIFIMHRQENLLNKALVHEIIQAVAGEAQNIMCVFVMHELTRTTLENLGLLREIESNPNILTIGRMPYLEFIQLLDHSEFMITDGGGNQQEAYYLGKPCLLLRNVTEGHEGVGQNVLLSGNNIDTIHNFMSRYEHYQRDPIVPAKPPSQIVVDTLLDQGADSPYHA